jgi:hypothetical protein
MEKDTDFIQGKRIESYNGDSFIVKKNTESREYSPDRFIDLILECYYLACDEKESAKEKLLCLLDAKATIDRYLNEYNLNVHHDFSRILLDLKSQTEKYKTILEYNLDATGNSKKRFLKPTKPFPDFLDTDNKKLVAERLKEKFHKYEAKELAILIMCLGEKELLDINEATFKLDPFLESWKEYVNQKGLVNESVRVQFKRLQGLKKAKVSKSQRDYQIETKTTLRDIELIISDL